MKETVIKLLSYYFGFLMVMQLFLFSACSPDNSNTPEQDPSNLILAQYLKLPTSPFAYENLRVPAYLDASSIETHDNTPSHNPITDAGATLGRVLFYDTNLSENNTISCASCHHQSKGFSDHRQFSSGFNGGKTARHSMGLSNARYRENGRFFWDERAGTLEEQVLLPIQDPVEMGMTLPDLEIKLQSMEYYPILFKRAFGDETINSHKISLALAQFVRTLISFNSKFDQGRALHEISEPFSNFTNQENLGKEIFHSVNKGMCSSCHFTEAMITGVSRNNGLTRELSDIGLEGTTGDPLDRYKFKAPSLRNITVRPPYMHDGDYTNLGDVIEGYNTGISWTPTLDAHLMLPGNTAAKKLNLTSKETEALEAFLHTLTDEEFLTNEIYSNPFK